jgi:hypothetical protein
MNMNNWIIIMTFTYPHEAHLIKTKLESEGIAVIIRDEYTVQVDNFYSNAIGGVKLMVQEQDYEVALALLKESGNIIESKNNKAGNIELIKKDGMQSDGKCPFCQSDNISKVKQPDILTLVIYFILGVLFPIFRRSYKCFNCDKEWKYVK